MMDYQKAWLELKSRVEDLQKNNFDTEDKGMRLLSEAVSNYCEAVSNYFLSNMEEIENEMIKDADLKLSDKIKSEKVKKNVYIVQRNKLGEHYKIIAQNRDSALRALKRECRRKGVIFKADRVIFVSEFESEIAEERNNSVNCLSPLEIMSLNHFLNTSEQNLIDLKNN